MPALFLIVFSLLFLPFAITAQSTFSDSIQLILDQEISDASGIEILTRQIRYELEKIPLEKQSRMKDLLHLDYIPEVNFQRARVLHLYAEYLKLKQASLEEVYYAYEKALDLVEAQPDPKGNTLILLSIGNAYVELDQMDKALPYLEEALEIAHTEAFHKLQVYALYYLGYSWYLEGDFDTCLPFLRQGMRMARSYGYHNWLPYFNILMADYYRTRGDDSSTFYFLEEALRCCTTYVDSIEVMNRIGQVHLSLNEKEAGLASAKIAYNLAIDNQLFYKVPVIANNIGHFFQHDADYSNAIAHYQAALDVLEDADQWQKILFLESEKYRLYEEACKGLAQSYEQLSKYDEALHFHRRYRAARDSILSFEKKQFTQLNAMQFKLIQLETENDLLRANQQIYKNDIRRLVVISAGIFLIVLLSILLAVIFKRGNNKRQEYAVSLERKVAARRAMLTRSNQQLKKNNNELQAFAYITSHDLKEPLRNISGFSSLLEKAINNKEYNRLPEMLVFIKKNVKQMFTLIDDITAYTSVGKLASGKEINLEDVQEFIDEELSELISAKNASIHYEFNAPKKTDILLPPQVKIALRHLVENGIKYNDQPKPSVWVNLEDEDQGHLVFSVKDNGIGIQKEFKDKIFEMFKRLHTRETYDGSGIGLAICKKAVEYSGGKVYLENSDGHGSNFIIQIPRESA
jgi:signal transduction histidine kinase